MTDNSTTLEVAEIEVLAQATIVLALLARLHDREPDRAFLDGLREQDVAGWLGTVVQTDTARQAAIAFKSALDALPDPLDGPTLDVLAAEYADIYLTHAYRIAPTGSVWLTEEHLERQEPMFEVRKWYAHYGIKVPDWRLRSDDHLAHELQFVAHLCKQGRGTAAGDAAKFLDRHVLNWVPGFSDLVTSRTRQPFFIAAAQLTIGYLEELRDILTGISGIERPVEEEKPEIIDPEMDEDSHQPYMPGIAESW